MADIKTLNTRIKLRYDEYANWTSKNPVLLAGEVAIATVPSGANIQTSESTTMQHLPNIVMKVGDGATEYNRLPFLSALAADVYGWAKKAAPDINDFTWLPDYVDGRIDTLDTDTQYTIQAVEGKPYSFKLMAKNRGEEDAAFKPVGMEIDLTNIDSRLDALEARLGGVSGESVADQIAAVVNGFNLTKLESAEGSGKVLSFIEQVNGDVNAEMRNLVEADIPALSMSKITDLDKEFAKKQNNLTFTDDYVAETSVITTKDYVDGKVATGININNNDAEVAGQFVVAAVQENGLVTVERRALASTDFADDVVPMDAVDGLAEEFAKKQDNLTFMTAHDAANPVATKTEIDALSKQIAGLDMAAVECGDGEILASAVQQDGLVTITKRALKAADFADDLIPEAAVNGLTERIDAKQDELAWAEGYAYDKVNNKAATVNYVTNAIAGLNGAMHFIGVVEGETFEAAVADLTPAAGDVILYGYDEYVYDAKAAKWVMLGNESIYQTKEQALADHNAINAEIAKKQDILGFEGEYNKESNKVVTKSAMDAAITSALDIDVASKKADGQVVLGVSQTDGEINVEHGVLTSAHFTDDVVPEAAVAGLTEALASKQNNLEFMTAYNAENNKVATASEITAINNAIAGMTEDVAVGTGEIISTIKQEGGVVTATTRKLAKEDIPTIEQSQVNGLGEALTAADTAAKGYADAAEAAAKGYADTQIGAAIASLDSDDTAVEGEFVTSVSMTDGELSVSRGKITTDFIEQGQLTLVFDCGGASATNIVIYNENNVRL